ncbi:MAG: Fur family transcriptional regulator [Campylobacterales bacterium]
MRNRDIKELLNSVGIRYTDKKALILKKIEELHYDFNANLLHKEVAKTTKIDIATIYRTLSSFKQKGLIREFLSSEGVVYEYVNSPKKVHPHFECKSCKNTICLDTLSFEDGMYLSTLAKGHNIKHVSITFSGICQECLNV